MSDILQNFDAVTLIEMFDVSRESLNRLEQYHSLLLKWQKAVNLVSPKTLDHAWERHFVDSLQVLPLIPAHVKVIADLGSGGGFPGLVIACVRDDLEIHSVESDMKKCQFQSHVYSRSAVPVDSPSEGDDVSRETILATLQEPSESKRNFFVHNKRIEQAYGDVSPDLITARALASLDKLFGYVYPWVEDNPAVEFLFLKGGRAQEEIEDALKIYDFDYSIHQSVTDPEASILSIQNLQKK